MLPSLVILALGVVIGTYITRPGVGRRDADPTRDPAVNQPANVPPVTPLPTASAPPPGPAQSQPRATPVVPKRASVSDDDERPKDTANVSDAGQIRIRAGAFDTDSGTRAAPE